MILAALKKFGLVEDEGSGDERMAKLTGLGLDLVLDPDPAHIRRHTALVPRFHRQMWDEYGESLPSAATLRHRLIREFGFTQTGAEEFIDEYRETIEFADLISGESEADAPTPAREGGQSLGRSAVDARVPAGPVRPAALPASSQSMTIPIPLLGEGPVYLTGEFPLTEEGWGQMMRVLEAMRPGLVAPNSVSERNLPPTASPEPEARGEAEGGVRFQGYGNPIE